MTAVNEVRGAIDAGTQPTLIVQGSSGSYFCRDRRGKIIGVFKPKSEEPYGEQNPKWAKWIHRTFLPCCFGRGCLIPNSGYLSEAGASIIDQALDLNVVPRTEVVQLSSPAFHYSFMQKRMSKRGHPPLKIGSFQLFVTGYHDAEAVFHNLTRQPLTDAAKLSFRHQFERLVILDYIIRNTDRGAQNWMIKFSSTSPAPTPPSTTPQAAAAAGEYPPADPASPSSEHGNEPPASATPFAGGGHAAAKVVAGGERVGSPAPDPISGVSIAAIDNGLAFPFKHPDNWRNYPFAWVSLSAAKVPFSDETATEFLPKLQDPDFVDVLVQRLRDIFHIDPRFSEELFQAQMSVLRGQIFNLVESLERRYTPAQMAEITPIVINQVEEHKGIRRWVFNFRKKAPLFKSW